MMLSEQDSCFVNLPKLSYWYHIIDNSIMVLITQWMDLSNSRVDR